MNDSLPDPVDGTSDAPAPEPLSVWAVIVTPDGWNESTYSLWATKELALAEHARLYASATSDDVPQSWDDPPEHELVPLPDGVHEIKIKTQ